MTRTLWGTTQIDNPTKKHPSILEVESWRVPLEASLSEISLKFSHWYLSGQDDSEQFEREQMVFDLVKKTKARAAALTVTGQLLESPLLRKRVESYLSQCEDQEIKLFLDFGKFGHPRWLNPKVSVFDPLWFDHEPWSIYWKIHGWHSERWVRKYSEADLLKLIEMANHFSPEFVILAHSCRYEQWLRIQDLS